MNQSLDSDDLRVSPPTSAGAVALARLSLRDLAKQCEAMAMTPAKAGQAPSERA